MDVSDLRLRTTSISSPRLNWNPDVHRYFDEDLHFVLFRVNHTPRVSTFVSGLMEAAGIPNYSSYITLGYYDVLLRFWATRSAYSVFVRACAERESRITHMRSAVATGIQYFWIDSGADRRSGLQLLLHPGINPERQQLLMRNDLAIRRIAAEILDEATTATVSAFIADAILLVKPAEPVAVIKVFILLQPTGDRPASDEVASIVERLASTHPLFRNASLYATEGDMCDFILRLAVSKFEDILSAARTLDEWLERLPIRTTTLFVGESSVDETDNVNNITRLSASEYELANYLGVENADIGNLTSQSRAWLRDQADFAAQLGPQSKVRLSIAEALAAAVRKDRERLREKLSYMVDFEHFFRNYVVTRIAEIFGRDWYLSAAVKYPAPFRGQNGVTDQSDTERWSLGILVQLLRLITVDDEYARAVVSSDLGEDWLAVIRPLFESRNAFAHGRLVQTIPDISRFDGQWGNDFSNLIRAWPLHEVLKSYNDSAILKGQVDDDVA